MKKFLKVKSDGKFKIMLLIIDAQNDFLPGGSLEVPGSGDDIKRLVKFVNYHIDEIDTICYSLDTHQQDQIFHPAFWLDKNGNQPEPFTVITHQDLIDKKWLVKEADFEQTEKCLREIKELTVWPYHCLENSDGYKLDQNLLQAIENYAQKTDSKPIYVKKGQDKYSEMYGILEPEYNPNNWVNQQIIDLINNHDLILVAGEAASHCVLASLEQIDKYCDIKKVIALRDVMSSIAGFEQQTEQRFKLLEQKGLRITKTKIKVVKEEQND